MQRSGIHAVAEWIRMSLAMQGYNTHYDNAVPLERPSDIARFLPPKGDLEESFLWMVEHEDAQFIDLPPIHPKICANFECYDVLVIRDVFNTMASRRKMNTNHFSRRAVQMWKQYAFEASGATNFLGINSNKVVVRYNAWHKQPHEGSYRETVAKSFQIEGVGSEVPLKQSANSSWQPPATLVSELLVFDRWKNYADDEAFWNVFKGDKQLYELNTNLFGPNQEILAKM